jgi:hypothetical protein
MENVCDYIFYSLEGAKKWIASSSYTIECERLAFLETFEECQRLAKENDLKPEKMLKELEFLQMRLCLLPKPPLFSYDRWLYKSLEARVAAITYARDLIKGTSDRFLW